MSDTPCVKTDIYELACRVLGTKEDADRWMTQPALALNGKRPAEVMKTEAGAEEIRTLLMRHEYGLF